MLIVDVIVCQIVTSGNVKLGLKEFVGSMWDFGFRVN